jgi:hypothetical protein
MFKLIPSPKVVVPRLSRIADGRRPRLLEGVADGKGPFLSQPGVTLSHFHCHCMQPLVFLRDRSPADPTSASTPTTLGRGCLTV